ncbi:MAG: 4'-phosphopantetheinyl transferase superfamily protein [Oscillospiraceae bacterium]|nr:4'-phosphopantetheinyl transferase superfamily protein [Oscillospiraceae bacterium]
MTQIYYMRTDALKTTGALCDSLSALRREKIARAGRDADKRLLLGAGLLLDRALHPFGLREQDAEITLGAHGKPYLAGRDDLFFSLSHSGSIALCAVSDRELGADVQECRDVREELLRRVCTEAEYAALASCAQEEKKKLFLRLWTAKESYLKYLGTGLTRDPGRLAILQNGVPVPPERGLWLHEYELGTCRVCICCHDSERPALSEEVFP